ncbi:methyltransferase domain-containing protein, partial [bacterium]|nr:methyltransferase domain-containing protein [bacterium]
MKILLIRPDSPENSLDMTELILTEPLELEIIYTHLVKKHDVKIIDLQVQDRTVLFKTINDWQPDKVCLTGYINQIGRIKDLCRKFKRLIPNIVTIVGGVHAAVCPEDFQSEVIDFILLKNQINSLDAILNNDFLTIKTRDHNHKMISCDNPDPMISSPLRPVFEKYKHKFHYLHHNEVAIVKTSFGCPYNCSFCFCTKISPYKAMDIEKIVDEIKNLAAKNIFIVDDTFLFNEKRLEKFYQLMKSENIKKNFIVYGRSDFIATNKELMIKLASIGILNVIVGLESLSENELCDYNKKLSNKDNIDAVKVLHDCGIEIFGLFIAHPNWKKSDFTKLYESCRKMKLRNVTLSIFTPFPGTEDYNKFHNIMDIKRNEYHKWDFTYLPYKPSHMSKFAFYFQVSNFLNKINLNRHNLQNIASLRPSLFLSLLKVGFKIWRKIITESFFSRSIWDFWADYYDGLWAQKYSLGPTQKKVTDKIKELGINGMHLDLGCGTGKLIHEMDIEGIKSVGLDRSINMLKNVQQPINSQKDIFQGSGTALPFKDNCFDCLTALHSLPYMFPKSEAFKEFSRVCKKDGILIIANANAETLWDHFFIMFIKMT